MSNRTLVELNHDFCPTRDSEQPLAWAERMVAYMRSGDKSMLPMGVTWKHMRHHSEPDPLEALQKRNEQLLAALENLLLNISTDVFVEAKQRGIYVHQIKAAISAVRGEVTNGAIPRNEPSPQIGERIREADARPKTGANQKNRAAMG